MASYKIEWKHSAEKELRGIDRQAIPRTIQAVERLADDPFPSGHRKLHETETTYRIRIGEYRVIYQVDSEKNVITIYHVRHRKEAYRK